MNYENNIEGWMAKEELEWLRNKAEEMESIAEIGSYKGKSTHALLTGCKGKVYAIDHWMGSKGLTMNGREYDEFIKNVGHFKNLEVVRASSREALKLVDKVDMVFIDGDHTFEGVRQDIKNWLPKANKIICGHDYDLSEVEMAVNDRLGVVGVCGSIWYKTIC